MKEFFKENLTLVIGLSLPVLLILMVLLAQAVTKIGPGPQYSAVFSFQTTLYGEQPYAFKIEDDRLAIHFTRPEESQRALSSYPAGLYVFDPRSRRVQNFDIAPPDQADSGQTIILDTPAELQKLRLDPSLHAPDGFYWERQGYRRSGNLFTEIFGYSRRTPRHVLRHNGRTETFDLPQRSHGRIEFVGWIIEGDE